MQIIHVAFFKFEAESQSTFSKKGQTSPVVFRLFPVVLVTRVVKVVDVVIADDEEDEIDTASEPTVKPWLNSETDECWRPLCKCQEASLLVSASWSIAWRRQVEALLR